MLTIGFNEGERRSSNEHRSRDDPFSQQRRACGELLTGVQRVLLAVELQKERFKTPLRPLIVDKSEIKKAAEGAATLINSASLVLKGYPETRPITLAARDFNQMAGNYMDALGESLWRGLGADQRAQYDESLRTKRDALEATVNMYLRGLKPPTRDHWWHRKRRNR